MPHTPWKQATPPLFSGEGRDVLVDALKYPVTRESGKEEHERAPRPIRFSSLLAPSSPWTVRGTCFTPCPPNSPYVWVPLCFCMSPYNQLLFMSFYVYSTPLQPPFFSQHAHRTPPSHTICQVAAPCTYNAPLRLRRTDCARRQTPPSRHDPPTAPTPVRLKPPCDRAPQSRPHLRRTFRDTARTG